MNKAQREPWFILNLIPWSLFKGETMPCLCAWCRYASWYGNCREAELECSHPLEVISEESFGPWEGNDCWGFRPDIPADVAADITGMWLRQERPNWDSVPRLRRRVAPAQQESYGKGMR